MMDILAPVLTDIYNVYLLDGVFPRHIQAAKVTALFKKGDKKCLSNYRPVSVLPILPKGLGKVNS